MKNKKKTPKFGPGIYKITGMSDASVGEKPKIESNYIIVCKHNTGFYLGEDFTYINNLICDAGELVEDFALPIYGNTVEKLA